MLPRKKRKAKQNPNEIFMKEKKMDLKNLSIKLRQLTNPKLAYEERERELKKERITNMGGYQRHSKLVCFSRLFIQ